MKKLLDLFELDGYEFLCGEDSTAEVEYDVEYNPITEDEPTGITLVNVIFNGDEVLERLTESERSRLEEEILNYE